MYIIEIKFNVKLKNSSQRQIEWIIIWLTLFNLLFIKNYSIKMDSNVFVFEYVIKYVLKNW